MTGLVKTGLTCTSRPSVLPFCDSLILIALRSICKTDLYPFSAYADLPFDKRSTEFMPKSQDTSDTCPELVEGLYRMHEPYRPGVSLACHGNESQAREPDTPAAQVP